MKKTLLLIITISFFIAPLFLNAWDDEELFYTKVKPNIMVLFDNSGSMNTIIFHPEYAIGDGHGSIGSSPGNRTYTRWFARFYYNGNSYTHNTYTGVYEKDGEDRLRVGSYGDSYLSVGD